MASIISLLITIYLTRIVKKRLLVVSIAPDLINEMSLLLQQCSHYMESYSYNKEKLEVALAKMSGLMSNYVGLVFRPPWSNEKVALRRLKKFERTQSRDNAKTALVQIEKTIPIMEHKVERSRY